MGDLIIKTQKKGDELISLAREHTRKPVMHSLSIRMVDKSTSRFFQIGIDRQNESHKSSMVLLA